MAKLAQSETWHSPASCAVFGPQSKAPSKSHLDEVFKFLRGKKELEPLIEAISTLQEVWTKLAHSNEDIAKLGNGSQHIRNLSQWGATGDSSKIASCMSGIISLPILVVIQVSQYFQYLNRHDLSHSDFLSRLQVKGGIQGYCGGLPSAVAIACSKNETEVVLNSATAVRIAVAIGAYGELGDDGSIPGATTIVIRLHRPGQGEELVSQFPGTYISAVTDPKTISVVGPPGAIHKLQNHVREQGLLAHEMHIRGKVHNPENATLAGELSEFCETTEGLSLPQADSLQCSLRSNRTGDCIIQGSLTREIISVILAERCEWFQLLTGVAGDLEVSGSRHHDIAIFGIGDCVPLSPFHQRGLQVTKIDVQSLLSQAQAASATDENNYVFPQDAIAIVGASCRLPGANDLEELWALLISGESQHKELDTERFDLRASFRASQDQRFVNKRKFYGNFIDNVGAFDNNLFGVNSKEASNMDPQQRVLLELAFQAVDSSGYLRAYKRGSGDPVGCFVGASFAEYLDNTNAFPPTAYTSTGTIRAFLSGKVSHFFGWTGPSEILDTACSSSLVAINRACKSLQAGECSMALAGGINIITGINNFLDLAKAGFLSPTGQCKPFDASADGYCRSEGGGFVFLKLLDKALSSRDHILGVIPAVAHNQGGISASLTIPHSPTQIELYRRVLKQAALTPEHITYVEAHGTGTQAGDPLEMASIRQVFGSTEREELLSIGSLKGSIGHAETAAGIASLLKVLAMLRHRSIPPQTSHRNLNPTIPSLAIDKIEIALNTRPWRAPLLSACVNSYGAAGSNCAVICCEGPGKPSFARHAPLNYPVIISANSRESLQTNMSKLSHFIQESQQTQVGDLSYTLSEKRKFHRHIFTATVKELDGFAQMLEDKRDSCVEVPQVPKKVVLVFGGQSKRTISFPRALYDTYVQIRRHIDDCDRILKDLGHPAILPGIFQDGPLTDIVILQCGTFAVQFACASCWIDNGLQVDTVVGHSFGELTAMVVSGALSLRDGLVLIASRAVLMKTRWGPEPGAMLAIHHDRAFVEGLVSICNEDKLSTEIEIACFNGPTSQVVVGTAQAIQRTEKLLRTEPRFAGVKCQRVDVTHGFHSTLTEPILDELDQTAASISWGKPCIAQETCTASQMTEVTRSRPTHHAREPVFFQDAVQRIEKRLGPCVWLEAGVNSPVVSMVKKALSMPENHCFQSLTCSGSQDASKLIADITTNMWREGLLVSYWIFSPPDEHPFHQIWLPPYQYQRTRHWVPNIDRVIEAQGTNQSQETVKNNELTLCLVRPRPDKAFEICTDSQRFQKILGGHAVRNRPLCPASMYMETVVMALQVYVKELRLEGPLHFIDLQFQAALGIDLDREVFLKVEKKTDMVGVWHFEIQSCRRADPRSKISTHAKGDISNSGRSELSTYERLVGDQIHQLRQRSDTDTLSSKRAYKLFSRVVRYADFLQGISQIILDEREALATINLPKESQFGLDENSALRCFDAVAIDVFIQVGGLLVNTSSLVTEEDVCVATAIGRLSVSPSCEFHAPSTWTVYAKFVPVTESQVSGDIFVWTEGMKLAVAILDAQFTKLPITKLDRLLDSANHDSASAEKTIKENTPSLQSSFPSGQTPQTSFATVQEDTGDITPAMSTPSLNDVDADARCFQTVAEMLSGTSGAPVDSIKSEATLQELGIDSLSSVELKGDLEKQFNIEIEDDQITLDTTVGDVLRLVGFTGETLNTQESKSQKHEQQQTMRPEDQSNSTADPPSLITLADPLKLLALYPETFDANATGRGFTRYWTNVAPKQDELLLAYICEALEALNSPISTMHPDQPIPSVDHLPKHTRVVQRLIQILKKHGIIKERNSTLVRGGKDSPSKPSSELHQEFLTDYPAYAREAQLMHLTGPRLADCLTGKVDPLSLVFQGTEAQSILKGYYTASPMLSTVTEQLVHFIHSVISSSTPHDRPIRILEVGAGFGGTTTRLADAIQTSGRPIEYIFSDISYTLVKSAKAEFAKYPWMKFQALNLEKEMPQDLVGSCDIVIGTNCVHATVNKTETIRRLKTLLSSEGFMVLSEVTELVDWYDIVFGLLDGWWLANDGSTYPLQPAESWVQSFVDAGFDRDRIAYSSGPTRESNSQRLLVASNKPGTGVDPLTVQRPQPRVQTVVYKSVETTDIEADIYLPSHTPAQAMPVALLIHGGGYVTLSKKAIRRHQASFLLAQGVLPVSIDHRLCPEINMIDGPIKDVGDAYAWIKRGGLQDALRDRDILVDADRVVVVGWSTGGHLAMTTAWTCQEAGLEAPVAILSFYGPTDFESGDLDIARGQEIPNRRMSMDEIFSHLSPVPITSHTTAAGSSDESDQHGLRPGDPRSELVLSLFKDGHGLSLLLGGVDFIKTGSHSEKNKCPDNVALISPLFHVRRGSYKTPTFLIHGTRDEVVPFHTAKTFEGELKKAGVKCGLAVVDGARHLHDLNLKEGDKDWWEGVGIGYEFLLQELGLWAEGRPSCI